VPEGVWPESGQEQIVGQSPALKQVLALAERLAPSDAAVLIAGEPGSGKESIARAIHRLSARRSFVKIRCVTTAGQLRGANYSDMGKGRSMRRSARTVGVRGRPSVSAGEILLYHRILPADWSWPTREPCFWMSSRNCRWIFNPS
jgi:transcriptional regulator of acetoin/glycerol metabolism